MVDELLQAAEVQYRRGKQFLADGALEPALIAFHQGLESLLRWGLVRDGADFARATDPALVSWQDLITYLDARYGVPRPACAFLGQLTHLYLEAQAGRHPPLSPELLQRYAEQVTLLYRRFFPRSQEERDAVAMRAAYGRPRSVDEMTAMPPERANDTRIVVPAPDAAPAAPPAAARPAPPSGDASAATPGAAAAPEPAPAAGDRVVTSGAVPGPTPPRSSAAAGDLTVQPGAVPGVTAPRATPPGDRVAAARAASGPPHTPLAAGDLTVQPGSGAPGLTAPPSGVRASEATPPLGNVYETHEARATRLADVQKQRAVAAGQRVQEMRQSGLEYCPRCGETVMTTADVCPSCGLDLAAYRAQHQGRARASGPGAPSTLERLFGRRQR